MHFTGSVTADSVTAKLRNACVWVLASGDMGSQLKFYTYSRDSKDHTYLVELLVTKAGGSTQATLKATGSDAPLQVFTDKLTAALSQ